MQLKYYQKQIVEEDLPRFLQLVSREKNVHKAFSVFWREHPRTPIQQLSLLDAVRPYKDTIRGVPHICVKVPTGGGKTLIASASIKSIFSAYDTSKPKVVVWLVPSTTILDQTLKNLRNPAHPYRQRLDIDFGGKVEVYDKQQALTGQGFNMATVQENLSIIVMSFDSLRARKKEDRKVFQENGYLHSFQTLLETKAGEEEIALMSILQELHPVVCVDESHNAESELSVEMLKNLSPSFILDLTATPRENSNVISFVDALELKKENMVKLPVIVYNHQNKKQVIDSALNLQHQLEMIALQGDTYIRPIVLFQAEANTGDDKETFMKVKNNLLRMGIPEDQIKVKTAEVNELKNVNLMDKSCQVRYIITVNALKEGWDCPFAYILASLADRSSAVDVEQIVGRVLRLPYARQNENALLNMSYVLTASAKFDETLQHVVRGLNNAGFSEKDYRKFNETELQAAETEYGEDDFLTHPVADLFSSPKKQPVIAPENEDLALIDTNYKDVTSGVLLSSVSDIIEKAKQEDEILKERIEDKENTIVPSDIISQVKKASVQSVFAKSAEEVTLPMFFPNEVAMGSIFAGVEEPLVPEDLLKGFDLTKCDANIDFEEVDVQMYRIDLNTEGNEHTPIYLKVDDRAQRILLDYINGRPSKDLKIQAAVGMVTQMIGKLEQIKSTQVKSYITRIIEPMCAEQFDHFLNNRNAYADLILKKIEQLSNEYKRKAFKQMIDTGKISIKANYKLPKEITIKKVGAALPKSLYEREEEVNTLENKIINRVANLDNVEWWTRNIVGKKGFYINGFIKHYPDFIIKTKKGVIVLLETKGAQLVEPDKIDLGNLWASKAGDAFRYYMVYDERDDVSGAMNLKEFISRLKEL